ncbi:GSU3473 family protein [Syntrophorhabdus aromaticivorans]|uniref:GSU3473 family protein n=1 Tax=Syntrophorhabdus aromaticivorans TaxID=328301 RepID=UPI003BF9B288
MLLRIRYPDSRYDYVDVSTLDKLMEFRRIRQFFRPSEQKWIDISRDPVRGPGG